MRCKSAPPCALTRRCQIGLLDHEHVFWIGDLNYRIDLPDEHVRNLVALGSWAELFDADQLRLQQLGKLAFWDFHEGRIAFAPTYKYDPESEVYDTSEKRRAPAWCVCGCSRGARSAKQVTHAPPGAIVCCTAAT